MNRELLSSFQGAIVSGAIGDALGWITEFIKSKSELKKKFNIDYITDFQKWEKRVGSRFNGYTDLIKKGEYSDDTQLMLPTARGIKPNGEFNVVRFSKIELPFWLNYCRGAGKTIKTAADKIQRSSAYWYNNFFEIKKRGRIELSYTNAGANGSAMRISPIALANYKDTKLMMTNIWKNSIVTHGHPRAIIGSLIFARSIQFVLHNKKKFDPNEFIIFLGKSAIDELNADFEDTYLRAWLDEWNKHCDKDFKEEFENTKEEVKSYLRLVYKAINDKQSDDQTVLNKFGCFARETKGSGTGTVCAGIYLFTKYYQNFNDCILKPVNFIGADTDSIANFSGTLAGVLHGIDAIPQKWQDVQDYEYLKKIGESLYLIACGEAMEEKVESKPENIISIEGLSAEDAATNQQVYSSVLGMGIVRNVDRKKLNKNKQITIIKIDFNIGQSIYFTIRSGLAFAQNGDLQTLEEQILKSDFKPEIILNALKQTANSSSSEYKKLTDWLYKRLKD